MITLVDNKKKKSQTVRTNDILAGTTFRGTVTAPNGEERTGLWLQLGTYNPRYLPDQHSGPYTVGLHPRGTGAAPSRHSFLTHCTEVRDYEPVDIKIIIEG